MSTVATGLVTIASGFLLGCAASHWRADGVLWHEVLPGSLETSLAHYQDLVRSPPWVNATVVGFGAIAIGALLYKLSLGDVSAFLYDGGSLVLFGAIAIVYGTNVQRVPAALEALKSKSSTHMQFELLKDLASSNCIIAVALTGVLALQAAQYYSNRSEDTTVGQPVVEPAAAAPAQLNSLAAPEIEKPAEGRANALKPKRSSARLRQQAASEASS